MSFNLRKRTRLSYYEPEELRFDEYLYCERCADFVYDYCAVHGPLLVVPDNKVPMKSNISSGVPRAALTLPDVFLHLAPSVIPGAGLGVFSTRTLPRGVRFGPYCGRQTQHVDSMYCWQIYDSNNKRSHVLDGLDSDRSNWMRYVNCARHWKEQNLVAYQYKGQLYYRTIKIIPRYTELMVFYGSEFANSLHINLSRYNSPKYYKEIISIATNTIQETKDDCNPQEYITADQFHFIDENLDEDDKNKNSTEMSLNSNILSSKIDDSSLKEIARRYNETKEDCMPEEYIAADQFHFIDENLDEDDKNKNSTEMSLNSNILSSKIRDSSLKEIARSNNETKEDSKDDTRIRYECEICQKTFASKSVLKEHSLAHSDTWKFNCDYCQFRSNKNYNFKQHIWKHTNTFQFFCETCPFKTNYERSFKKHCFRHTKVLEIISSRDNIDFPTAKICEICDFKTNSRKVFSTHMSKHKGNVYKCDHCSYSNHSKYNLSRHLRSLKH